MIQMIQMSDDVQEREDQKTAVNSVPKEEEGGTMAVPRHHRALD